MKYEQLWKDIETLCALRGPSGREAAVREYLIEQIKGHAEYEVDPLGNLLVRKKGKKPAGERPPSLRSFCPARIL